MVQDFCCLIGLPRLVREGSVSARKWIRESLLAQLRGVVQLRVIPNFKNPT